MGRIEIVTSAANPLLKEVRRAAARGVLTSDGLWIAEGFHLLEEALRSGVEVPAVLAAESARARVAQDLTRLVVIPDKLFDDLTTTQAGQGVIALVRPPVWTEGHVFRQRGPVVVLDGIQDAGNAGAIVRAAEAFNASGILFARGTVSPHNPKTLRAAAGSLFRIPFLSGLDAAQVERLLVQHRRTVYAAMPPRDGSHLIQDIELAPQCALIVGGEGAGVSPELLRIALPISVPTSHVESLNASVAAAILLYEMRA